MNIDRPSSVRMARTAPLRVLLLGLALGLCVAASPVFAAGSSPPSDISVNINTASADELQALPGIGQSRAEQIVALRKERGPFRSVDDLIEVRGIGPAMLERMRPQVSLSGKTRLTPSSSAPGSKPTKKSGH